VLAVHGNGPAVVLADCDPQQLAHRRSHLPALQHRRL
jgi:predicted amidohydrolase